MGQAAGESSPDIRPVHAQCPLGTIAPSTWQRSLAWPPCLARVQPAVRRNNFTIDDLNVIFFVSGVVGQEHGDPSLCCGAWLLRTSRTNNAASQDRHLERLDCPTAITLLEIGCGWVNWLSSERIAFQYHGITLSPSQKHMRDDASQSRGCRYPGDYRDVVGQFDTSASVEMGGWAILARLSLILLPL
jgi:hypothetical protein